MTRQTMGRGPAAAASADGFARRALVTGTALALAAACLAAPRAAWSAPPAPQSFDILIKGGHIIDGTGNPWYAGDVGIRDGRIAGLGELPGATAKRVIDATGKVVTPGYIDLHTHTDMSILADPLAQSKVRQGVTLDVIGESQSVAPRDGLPQTRESGPQPDWTTFTGYFDRLKRQGASMNIISHAAFEQIRLAATGYGAGATTPAQLERMKMLMARSMEEGAWGMVLRFESGGPRYPEEVIELAKTVHQYGGNVTAHIGSEGFEQDQELDFMFRMARETKVPIHIFHYKIRGEVNWPKQQHYIDRINAARAEGIDVTVNQYPYTAMNHGWNVFFPVWAREKGPEAFAKMLKDPKTVKKIKADPDFRDWVIEHGGWQGIVLARTTVERQKKYEGMRLAEIAKLEGDADPADTCLKLMAEAEGRIGGIFHTMSEDNVRLVMKQPWVAISSDAGAINTEEPGFPHPRAFGTNVKVLGYYVRDTNVLTLEDAVRKMSGLPAQILGLQDRGLLRQGQWADVVVVDPATVKDTATFEKPKSYAVGVPYVVVNGVLVIDNGQHTGAKPGLPLYGRGTATPH
ncbi:MAG: D-aminoacylase [Phenylobacterium sp.]|uniref:N-acyl-D-amino-acid deacylase family protein n=1 Tax=Phenylobacterium sp. TaxID=1871053 RepID=UPI001A48A96A|nr:D-aminoacylase [Phenylobacterium sp.]MBL8774029.1 D-aminoacylase [Phenylobacterium sp.]